MSYTRFNSDPDRLRKYAAESSFAGKYALNTPGPGDKLPYVEDPQMRMQFWGANLMTNTVNLESDLRGLTRKMNRDGIDINDYKLNAAGGMAAAANYGSLPTFIDESRATHPAWMYRNTEIDRWEQPFINPQANVEKVFPDNIQSRILEKDHFRPSVPVVAGNISNDPKVNADNMAFPKYYMTGKSVCMGGMDC